MSETVKPFTEDQRNRLAFAIENHAPNWVDKDNLAGLLARLAAAEDCADHGTCPDGATEYPCRKRTKWLATRGIGI